MEEIIKTIQEKAEKGRKTKIDKLVTYCKSNELSLPAVYRELNKKGLMRHLI